MILLIGDLQGCCEPLDRLLDLAGFSPSRDRLVVLGDLVNRGPASLHVLQRLAALGGSARCVLGNHDLHLLAVAHGVRRAHRSDTLQQLLDSPDRQHWLQWLRHQPLALMESGWLCVHAGLPPAWDTAQALEHAAEVSTALTSPDLPGLLVHLFGNEPSRWDDTLQGAGRLRFIVNALTRIRFCAADGTLELQTKEGLAATPAGLFPWFDTPGRRSAGQAIAFGHWSTLGLVNRPDLLGLDTGCVWGGTLSAARVDGGRHELLQVPCPQAQAPAKAQ
ncbi:MAG: symmetrical bis(5'-nucleosyl)-tetraphosphatase [Betaproteobacteria bacterium]